MRSAGDHDAGLVQAASWQQVGQQRRDMYMYSLLPHDLGCRRLTQPGT
jgi:hypothetical protein